VTKTVEQLLDEARARLRRLSPAEAADAQAAGALLVDIRPAEQRGREGEVPGALVIERNVLEWGLDPASADRIAEVTGHGQVVVVLCSAGYTSSLATASLQDMGFSNATDVAGGFQAWKAARLPVG
jgi:rhodanese-related sulfurtransferase